MDDGMEYSMEERGKDDSRESLFRNLSENIYLIYL